VISSKRRVLKQGAEAIIYLSERSGRRVVVKERIPKAYRDPALDAILRRERTIREAKMLSQARRAGVRTPIIYDVDVLEHSLVMQYIKGRTLRERFEEQVPSGIPEKIGDMAGTLHDAGIVHGDLTTSNMLLSSEIYLIDFGLSKRSSEIEDFGADFLLMEEALIGLHPRRTDVLRLIRKGYAKRFDRAPEVFLKVDEIKKRRRYV